RPDLPVLVRMVSGQVGAECQERRRRDDQVDRSGVEVGETIEHVTYEEPGSNAHSACPRVSRMVSISRWNPAAASDSGGVMLRRSRSRAVHSLLRMRMMSRSCPG